MEVHLDEGGDRRLVGRADKPENAGPVYEVPMFEAASTVAERFVTGVVTHPAACGGASVVELAVLLAPGQPAELLPSRPPLAS